MRTSGFIVLILLVLVLAAVAWDGQAMSTNMMGMTVSVASLGSITATTLSSPAADVNFVIDRAAGTLSFEGQLHPEGKVRQGHGGSRIPGR